MSGASSLYEPRVAAALERLFEQADRDDQARAWIEEWHPGGLAKATAKQRADLNAAIYMPISREGGQLLYNLVRAARPGTIVEFGTSFGISAIHLAAAVRDNGTGHVITTELNAEKAASARRTFAETGLDDLITILEGDARETLASVDAPVEFLLLDGWKDLSLSVLQLLEPRLPPGTLVIADDVHLESLGPYLAYVRNSENGYASVTFPVEDGMEISCRL